MAKRRGSISFFCAILLVLYFYSVLLVLMLPFNGHYIILLILLYWDELLNFTSLTKLNGWGRLTEIERIFYSNLTIKKCFWTDLRGKKQILLILIEIDIEFLIICARQPTRLQEMLIGAFMSRTVFWIKFATRTLIKKKSLRK